MYAQVRYMVIHAVDNMYNQVRYMVIPDLLERASPPSSISPTSLPPPPPPPSKPPGAATVAAIGVATPATGAATGSSAAGVPSTNVRLTAWIWWAI
jgi:hypothetical protein